MTTWQDLRYALRGLRRSPGFTAAAVLSLALGIGANTAIFSLADTLMFRSLPVRAPGELVEFLNQYPGDPPLNVFSWRSYEHFRDRNHVFSAITASHPARFHLRAEDREPDTVTAECVAGNFFPLLGIRPAIGRFIGPEDDRAGGPGVAVLSWSYWQSRFNLDPAVLGRRVVLENVPLSVVGVAPRDFFGLQVGAPPDIWTPLAVEWTINPRARAELGAVRLIARLRPGVSLEQARAEMSVLFRFTLAERTAASKDPAMRQLRFMIAPAGAGLSTPLRDRFSKPLLALLAVVALLLLIACTNIASLLLARAAARRREMAVRVALGASRLRLVRQVLTESLLLAAAGALLGIFLAYFSAGALVDVMTSGRFVGPPPRIDVPLLPNPHVLLFTAAIALLTGLLFGLAPAWNAFTSAPALALRESGRAGFRPMFGRTLVVAQVALSVGLLSAAGVFVGHLSALKRIDLGFRPDRVLLVTLDPPPRGLADYEDLLGRLERVPGVRSAALTAPSPLSGAGAPRFITVEGHTERPEDRRYVSVAWVAPKYFQTLGTPLLAGRDFSAGDRPGAPRVAIVSQALARFYFGARSPIGSYLTFDGDAQPCRIVGVAGVAKYYEIREAPSRTVYLAAFQAARLPATIALRTSVRPSDVAPAARRLIRDSLQDAAVARITTLAGQVDATIVPERLVAMLSGAFGALGALLAAIGIYGLLAYAVARRVAEIGVRMALGATGRAVSRMVIGEALAMTSAGLLIGVPLAWWARRFAASLIPDLPLDAPSIAFAATAMLAIALLAAWVPARRAARVDPIQALRCE